MSKTKEIRSVFLFGAGAAIDWDGPTTNELTKAICSTGFKNKNGIHITSVIYDWLIETSNLKKDDVNFETIINVIEDFVDFWSKTKSGQINGLAIFAQTNKKEKWDNLMDYKLIEIDTHKYKMEIPSGGILAIDKLKTVYYAEHPVPEAYYFELLLEELFNVIQARISNYSYLTYSHSKPLDRKENEEINKLAINYFQNKQKNSTLRLYSLNYDRVFQFLFEKAGIKADQGFNDDGEILPRSIVHFNPYNTHFKENENCIYHLHGSVFWEVVSTDQNGLDYYRYVQSPGPIPQSNNGFARIEMEKGKSLLIGNIITGYRKSQRTGLSPFRQLFSAFDTDCYKADELIIIGYSFSDPHINDIINKAREVNQNLNIEIVDPNIDIQEFLKTYGSKWKYFGQKLKSCYPKDHITEIPFLNLMIYKTTFKQYFKDKDV